MEVLAKRTVEVSGKEVSVEVVATGDGPMFKAEGCPMLPPSEMRAVHRLLSRFQHANAEGEGLTERGEMLYAVLGEFV